MDPFLDQCALGRSSSSVFGAICAHGSACRSTIGEGTNPSGGLPMRRRGAAPSTRDGSPAKDLLGPSANGSWKTAVQAEHFSCHLIAHRLVRVCRPGRCFMPRMTGAPMMKPSALTASVVVAQLLAASASAQSVGADFSPSAIERHARAYAIARRLEVDARGMEPRVETARRPANVADATPGLVVRERLGSARWLEEDDFAENEARSKVTSVDLFRRP